MAKSVEVANSISVVDAETRASALRGDVAAGVHVPRDQRVATKQDLALGQMDYDVTGGMTGNVDDVRMSWNVQDIAIVD